MFREISYKHGRNKTSDKYVNDSIRIAESIAKQVCRYENIRYNYSKNKYKVYKTKMILSKKHAQYVKKTPREEIVVEYTIYRSNKPYLWFELRNKVLTSRPINVNTELPINISINDIVY